MKKLIRLKASGHLRQNSLESGHETRVASGKGSESSIGDKSEHVSESRAVTSGNAISCSRDSVSSLPSVPEDFWSL
ncbi:Hypothetical protein NTJ_14408 [Nesidiocoris tenuis]|nr:Hypothetical protein NTJ_14408 [Nesidiocoris tenuis]